MNNYAIFVNFDERHNIILNKFQLLHLHELCNGFDRLHTHRRSVIRAGPAQVLEVLHADGFLRVEEDEVKQVLGGCSTYCVLEILGSVHENGVEYRTSESLQGIQFLKEIVKFALSLLNQPLRYYKK